LNANAMVGAHAVFNIRALRSVLSITFTKRNHGNFLLIPMP
jgi:hypothetical protein